MNTSLCDMASKYERQLRNPKGDYLVGVPTLTPIPTEKQRVTATAIVECNSTSVNELKFKWCPHAILCNDVDTIRLEGGTVLNGGAGIRGNAKYTNSQFLSDSVKSRLVAARLDVKAVGGQPNGTFRGGYGRDGRVVGTYTADDVTRLLNDKSSVVVPVKGNEVHLMYRPSDEVEREEWVRDCRDGPLPDRTITSTDYPARGIVIWNGDGDAASTLEAGTGGTYYEQGSTRTDLHTAGSAYTLYNGNGSTISAHAQGAQVTYVTSEHGNSLGTINNTPSDFHNTFNHGSASVQNTTNTSLGQTISTIGYETIVDSSASLGTLRMLYNGGHHGASTFTIPAIYIDCNHRCKHIRVDFEVLTSSGAYEWHTVYDTEALATSAHWSGPHTGQWAWQHNCQITGRSFSTAVEPRIGWNSIFRRVRINMRNFIDGPYLSSLDVPPGVNPHDWFKATLPVRFYYQYKDMWLNHITKKSYNSATGNLIGASVTGTDRGTAVTGVNLGTQTDVTTQGNAVTVSTSTVTVPRKQRFVVTINAVVESCGTAVSADRLSQARGSIPRPIDSYVGTAFATPITSPATTEKRQVPDSARDHGQSSIAKRVKPNRPRGMSPPRSTPARRRVPDSARVPSPPRYPSTRSRSPGADDYDFDSE